MTGEELARAALALVGTPFRLHGRDPALGLDCVGLLEAAAASCGKTIRLPNSYALRSRRLPRPDAPSPDAIAASLSLQAASEPARAGDVLLLRPGPCQHHLAIALGELRIVHAHAGLRKVVAGDRPEAWPLAGHWRPAPTD